MKGSYNIAPHGALQGIAQKDDQLGKGRDSVEFLNCRREEEVTCGKQERHCAEDEDTTHLVRIRR